MTDLNRLLDEAVASHRPAGDVDDVERRARRRERRRRTTAGLVAAGVFLGAAWFGWAALRPERAVRTGDDGGTGTYVLSDFDVGPHVDPRTDEVDNLVADVTFTTTWSSGVYPGDHRCALRVYDPSHELVGTLEFQLSALSEGRRHPVAVPITGATEGATADGSCSDERLDAAVSYRISDIRVVISRYLDRRPLEVVFTVGSPRDLPADTYVGSNACQAVVFLDDGSILGKSDFGLNAPSGEEIDAGVSNDVGEQISTEDLTANVVCIPFTREGVFPDATARISPDG